jgi:secreted PhoX family phosphatase
VYVFAVFSLAANNAVETKSVIDIVFTETLPPQSDEERTKTYTTSSAIVHYSDGSQKLYPLSYETLFRSGERSGSGAAGEILDKKGNIISESSADKSGQKAHGPFYAYGPDGNSLIQLRRPGKSNELFLVTQFEYHTEAIAANGQGKIDLYARLPMAVSLSRLKQRGKDGDLSVASIRNVNLKEIDGIWIPCAASLTPWNTHLAGEEYEPNAKEFENEPLESMNLYLGTSGKSSVAGGANPYRYGHAVEIKVNENGSTEARKRYAMGRLSMELAEIMPDERTAYMGDDGRDTMMFMFVADKPRDLSAGSLYAGRWYQRAAEAGGSADIQWIHMGHANEKEIEALIQSGIQFSDIFDSVSVAEYKEHPELFSDYKPVQVYEGQGSGRAVGSVMVDTPVYLKVKPGMEIAAAFLESRRYGAMLGATSEFTKMEGVTHNPESSMLYIAISYIEGGMLNGKNGKRPADHIKLEGDAADLNCGAVYEAEMGSAQKDSSGQTIKSNWVVKNMTAMLTGAKKPETQSIGPYDRCDTNRIANPDNIKYSSAMKTLFIGEDSANHLNNFLWAYQPETGQLTRILSATIGGELTGLQVVPDANGFAYIMSNVQHPGASNDLKQYPDKIKVELRKHVDQRGAVGYVKGMPAINR